MCVGTVCTKDSEHQREGVGVGTVGEVPDVAALVMIQLLDISLTVKADSSRPC